MRGAPRAALSLALALLAAAALRAAVPERAPREALSYALVVTLGYGHLLGASLGRGRGSMLRRALVAVLLLDLLALYLALVARAPGVVLLLLALATWHAAENELALAASRGGGPGPLARRARDHAAPLALTGATLALAAAALPEAERGPLALLRLPDLAGRGIRFADVFAVTTLQHLLSWLLLSAERALRDRALAARLLWVHALPASAAIALAAGPGELAPARALFFSPALYLFWSSAHVLQTARRRGLAPRAP